MTVQQFCLRWNNHQPNFISVFTSLLNNETLVDVTLAAEGKHLQAHKVVLSACSTYFQSLFTANPSRHPIVILKDVKHSDLKILVHFMYYGEVNVSQDQLPQILEAARMLKIKGLTEMSEPSGANNSNSGSGGGCSGAASSSAVNTTSDRANLLTPGESSWHSDAQPHHELSPHHSLSPTGRRKKSRKHSRSPSRERTIEPAIEQTTTTTVRSEPTNFTTAPPSNNPFCTKVRPANEPQQPNDYNTSKDSFDESGPMEGNLIIDAEEEQNECNIIRVSDPLTDGHTPLPSTPHQNNSQWSNMDATYQRYATPPFHTNNTHNIPPFNMNTFHSQELPFGMQGMINPYEYPNTSQNQSSQNTEVIRQSPGPSCSNSQTPQDGHSSSSSSSKRRRTTNPQSEENFQQALEAVRVGGIGFCKAARMFGVNNRTLWLEYKKKGYPNNRPSIKSRIKQEHSSPPPDENPPTIPDQQLTLLCQPHPVSVMGFIDPRPVDFTSGIQNVNRPRFVDDPMNLHNSPLNLHGINFNTLQ